MPKDSRAGVEINWSQRGQGEPALLVHCSLGHSMAWVGVMAELEQTLDIISFDLPDHGCSGATPDGAEMQSTLADVIVTFLDEPRHIIGHSFGATAAILASIRFPNKVLSLTVIEPVLFALVKETDALKQYDYVMRPFYSALAKQDFIGATDAFIELWGDGRKLEDLPPNNADYIIDHIHVLPLQSSSVYNDINNLLGPGQLERLAMPVSLIAGDRSPKVAIAIIEALHTRLPDALKFVITGAGHMAPTTHPRQVAEIVKTVLFK